MEGKISLDGRVIKITLVDSSKERARRLCELFRGHNTNLLHISSQPYPPYAGERIDRIIEQFEPDLMIIGLLLSENTGSGLEAINYCHETFPDVPIVCCSKYISTNPEDKPFYKNYKMALKAGAVAAFPILPFPKAEDFLQYARKD